MLKQKELFSTLIRTARRGAYDNKFKHYLRVLEGIFKSPHPIS